MNALHGKNCTFFEDCLLYSGLQIHSNVCLTLFLFYRNSVFTTLKYLQTYPPSLKIPQYVHLKWTFSCWTHDVHFIAVCALEASTLHITHICYVTKDTWRPTRSNTSTEKMSFYSNFLEKPFIVKTPFNQLSYESDQILFSLIKNNHKKIKESVYYSSNIKNFIYDMNNIKKTTLIIKY